MAELHSQVGLLKDEADLTKDFQREHVLVALLK